MNWSLDGHKNIKIILFHIQGTKKSCRGIEEVREARKRKIKPFFFFFRKSCRNNFLAASGGSRARLNHAQTGVWHLQTADCRLQTADCRLQTADCRLQTADCRLQTADCRLRTVDCRLQTADCSGPQTVDYKRRWLTAGRESCRPQSLIQHNPCRFEIMTLWPRERW